MDLLTNDFAGGILTAAASPCLSLYQPTHRHHPDNQQDPIRFRNLLKTLDGLLRQKYGTRDIRPLLEPFEMLARDEGFWNHTLDGLAALAAPGIFRVYRLQRAVPELAVAAESFHLKPLLRILQSADRYQILALGRGNVSLFEGNRDTLDQIDIATAAAEAIAEAQDTNQKESNLSVWTHGADSAKARVYQSQGSDEKALDSAAERFFRTVDRAILKHHSRASGLPLLLASLPQHQSLFRRISHNPLLMRKGIEIDPHALNVEELRERAWRVIEPDYLERLAGLVEMFGSARAKGLGSADLTHVANAAVGGRVVTLLVEAERHIPGRIDSSAGEVRLDERARPDVDDLLDDIAELVLRNGGQVVIVPAERMPTDTGLAAIYRF
jgi:hypothetical protein